jgi:exopolysaccharide biosynthesis polyprenyl glycosylphosphotransferase
MGSDVSTQAGTEADDDLTPVAFRMQQAGEVLRVTAGDVTVITEAPPEELRESVAEPSAAHARHRVAVGIAVGDVIAFIAAVVLSEVLRGASTPELVLVALPIPLWLALVGTFSNTSSSVIAGRLGLARVAGSVGILGCGVAIIAGGTPGFGPRIAVFVATLLGLDLVQRALWALYARGQRREGRLRLRTVLVGTGGEPTDFVDLLRSEASDLMPVGRFVMRGEMPPPDALPTFGRLSDIAELASDGSIDCLLVASSSFTREELSELRRFSRTAELQLRVFTIAPEALGSNLDISPLGPGALVSVRPAKLNGIQAVLKRGMDVVGSFFGLVLLSPVLAVVAVLVKRSSPGPVFFRQNRVTRGGRVFRIVKFRTMVTDVERIFAENGIDPTQPFFKPREDMLVTPVGRVLRATSLDELPQLWNVLRGQMSLVGPRPLPEDQVVANPALLEGRHDVRAGVTGWWQVNGRSDVSADEAVRQDLFYVENWSVGLDIRILLKTAGALLSRRGAY